MIIVTFSLVFVFLAKSSRCISCNEKCPPEEDVVCGFDALSKAYKMFPGKCAMQRFTACNKLDFIQTPIYFCIKSESKKSLRRHYLSESCPVFCPVLYRPVCGASMIRSYAYRTFTNGCQLDMINCRGYDETASYVEVPLSFCPRHAMRNIYKDQIIAQ